MLSFTSASSTTIIITSIIGHHRTEVATGEEERFCLLEVERRKKKRDLLAGGGKTKGKRNFGQQICVWLPICFTLGQYTKTYIRKHTLYKKISQGQEAPWCGKKHKDRHGTYVAECFTTYGSDSASWPPWDNDAWEVAVGGCHSNFMLGIGSQVNLEELGFGYRKWQPTGNSYVSLMISDMVDRQDKDREAMKMMREETGR